MTEKLFRYLKLVFSFDFRSLALFRISLSLLVLLDLWIRSRFLLAHYSDLGVFPRSLETNINYADWYFSLHNSVGSTSGEAVIFILNAICALALLIGYRTRLATFLCWLFLISLQNRNYLVLNAGDAYFAMLFFWGMFLPLGARCSLDRLKVQKFKSEPDLTSNRIFSAGTIALTFQILIVYCFSGYLKTLEANWQQGLGVFYSLSAETYATSIGKWAGDVAHRNFLIFLNPIILWFELFFGFLIFMPIKNHWFRILCILSFWLFHFSIDLMMEVGLLPLIGEAAWIVFIPSEVWDHFAQWSEKLIARGMRFGAWVTKNLPPNPVQKTVYGESRLSQTLAAFFFVAVIFMNLASLPKSTVAIPEPINRFFYMLRLNQTWSMFTTPTVEDGWFSIPGNLRNGTQIDLMKDGAPFTSEKPPLISKLSRTDRWRKYYASLYNTKYQEFYVGLSRYFCRQWNGSHHGTEELLTFEILYTHEDLLPEGGKKPPKTEHLLAYQCFN